MNSILMDLKVRDNCLKVTIRVDHAFNLAANMGRVGFIQSNYLVIMMTSFDMLEISRINGVERSFYTPRACVHPVSK